MDDPALNALDANSSPGWHLQVCGDASVIARPGE
jgi:hypothetical protein